MTVYDNERVFWCKAGANVTSPPSDYPHGVVLHLTSKYGIVPSQYNYSNAESHGRVQIMSRYPVYHSTTHYSNYDTESFMVYRPTLQEVSEEMKFHLYYEVKSRESYDKDPYEAKLKAEGKLISTDPSRVNNALGCFYTSGQWYGGNPSYDEYEYTGSYPISLVRITGASIAYGRNYFFAGTELNIQYETNGSSPYYQFKEMMSSTYPGIYTYDVVDVNNPSFSSAQEWFNYCKEMT